MRNLSEYPISLEEMIASLDKAIERSRVATAQLFGNTEVASLLAIKDYLEMQVMRGEGPDKPVPEEDVVITEEMINAGYDATRLPDGTPQFAEAGFCLGHAANIYVAMERAKRGETAE